MARNIKLVLEYEGTGYHGWQQQASSTPTIEGALRRALFELTGEAPALQAAGRTDAGVHALGQVVNFRLEGDFATEALPGALNHRLSPDIVVRSAEVVDDSFHARYSARSRRYEYHVRQAAGRAAYAVCSACHGPQAQGNQALNAPRLNSQAGWYLARQLRHFKQGIRGADDRDTYAKQMIPMAATLADDTAINNVVAYIDSLPDEPPPATLVGDPVRGKSLYTTCAACHGTAGQGVWSTNAPRLAHMSDWYLARQLHNFQQGIRGGHPQDFSGAQMVLMAKILPDDRAINDLLAYIHTL